VALLIFQLVLIYGAIVLLNPWAIHIGGQWTPLPIWNGTGKLVTAYRRHCERNCAQGDRQRNH
jgi:hypothetical protein